MALDDSLLDNIGPRKKAPMPVDHVVKKAKVKKVKINPWERVELEPEVALAPVIKEEIRTEEVKTENIEKLAPIKELKIAKEEVKIEEKTSKKLIKKKAKKFQKILKKKINSEGALTRPRKNYSQIPNEMLEFVFNSNLSGNEIRFLLYIFKETVGWGKTHCVLSKNDFLKHTTITNNRIYKTRDSLAENGIIEFGKDPDSTKSYYMIKSEFFGLIAEQNTEATSDATGVIENHQNDDLYVLHFEEVLSKLKNEKIRKKEEQKLSELVAENHDIPETMKVLEYLIEVGDLKGEPCIHPVSYLLSGTFQAVKNKMNGTGKNGLNGNLIWEAVTKYNTTEPLPTDIKEKLTEADLDFIQTNGGRKSLGQQRNLQSMLGI